MELIFFLKTSFTFEILYENLTEIAYVKPIPKKQTKKKEYADNKLNKNTYPLGIGMCGGCSNVKERSGAKRKKELI